jgi:hypothetical protein
MRETTYYPVDFWFSDQNGMIYLLVEVRARGQEDFEHALRQCERFIHSLSKSDRIHNPYALVVTTREIGVMRWNGEQFKEIHKFDANEVFSSYDPDYSTSRIFESYLAGLTETWLRDLMYHWRGNSIPKEAEFQSLGLAQLLIDTGRANLSQEDPGGER